MVISLKLGEINKTKDKIIVEPQVACSRLSIGGNKWKTSERAEVQTPRGGTQVYK